MGFRIGSTIKVIRRTACNVTFSEASVIHSKLNHYQIPFENDDQKGKSIATALLFQFGLRMVCDSIFAGSS